MKESEIKELATKGKFHNNPLTGTIEETHISWVIFTKKYAFKIKKPLKLSFLDFSTKQLRKQFCKREVELNNRFTDIYLNVLSITRNQGKLHIGREDGQVLDYAVQMKRMMSAKRMDNLLRQGKVHEENMRSLAKIIASFHQNADIITARFNVTRARRTFNDIADISEFVKEQLGDNFQNIILKSIEWSDAFLVKHAKRLQKRIEEGFTRDIHGDLHSGNIFLYKRPVVFDCVEFNAEYRQIDVLYEVAFLCMDLEAYHQKHLADTFLLEYTKNIQVFEVKEDRAIFVYFKCLRANIRAKVHALSALHAVDPASIKLHQLEVRKYLLLMKGYMK